MTRYKDQNIADTGANTMFNLVMHQLRDVLHTLLQRERMALVFLLGKLFVLVWLSAITWQQHKAVFAAVCR